MSFIYKIYICTPLFMYTFFASKMPRDVHVLISKTLHVKQNKFVDRLTFAANQLTFFFFFTIQSFLKFLFIHLFLAVLGLHCCVLTFSSCRKQGLLSSCDAQASHCNAFSYCGAWAVEHGLQLWYKAWLPHSMWDLPRPGIEPEFPALAGGFSTIGPPGKSSINFKLERLSWIIWSCPR